MHGEAPCDTNLLRGIQMFWVIEIQKNNGTWSQIVTQHATMEDAESKYYSILSYAAVSEIEAHGAVMFDDKGIHYNRKVYER